MHGNAAPGGSDGLSFLKNAAVGWPDGPACPGLSRLSWLGESCSLEGSCLTWSGAWHSRMGALQ